MYATIHGIQTAYSDRGRAHKDVLLLIHGFPLNRRMWEGQLAGLSATMRVIAPDLRGQGGSQLVEGPYTMEQHAQDAAGLLDHLGVRRAVVGGMSMGGYVTFAFWRLYPERARGLVLIDTRADPDSPEGKGKRDAAVARIEESGVDAYVREMAPTMLAPEHQDDPPILDKTLAIMRESRAPGLAGALLGMRDRPDSRPILAGITVPVLILVGEHDRGTPPAVARSMAEQIPAAQVVVIPRAGHLSPLENPRAVNAAIRAFVARLPA